jgi:uncharacterized caspase-like protein
MINKLCILTIYFLALIPSAALSKNIALLIGVSEYRSSPLQNPVNDVRGVALALEELGWDTVVLENPTREIAIQKISAFSQDASELSETDLSLLYFSGHGFQISGDSYLSFDSPSTSVGDLIRHSLSIDEIAALLSESVSGKILLVDACRDNPFLHSHTSSISSGLTQITAPSNTAIGFATAPHEVAYDGVAGSRMGPYATAIVRALDGDPTLDQFFRSVRRETVILTDGAQTPWETTSILYNYSLSSRQQSSETTQVIQAPFPPDESELFLTSLALESVNEAAEEENFARDSYEYIRNQIQSAPLSDFYIWGGRSADAQDRNDVLARLAWNYNNLSPQLFWSNIGYSLISGYGIAAACRGATGLDFNCGDYDRRLYIHMNPEFVFNVNRYAERIGGRSSNLAKMYSYGIYVTQDFVRAYDLYQLNFGRTAEFRLDEYTEVDLAEMMQTMLNLLGSSLTLDGDFGPATCSALRAYNIPQRCGAKIERETILRLAQLLAAR